MSYNTGTVLERFNKQGDAYDIVKIVGVNPIKAGDTPEEWVGGAPGNSVLVQPHGDEFGQTIPRLERALEQEYEVVHQPDLSERGVMPAIQDVTGNAERPPSPEDVFASQQSPEERFASESVTPSDEPGETGSGDTISLEPS